MIQEREEENSGVKSLCRIEGVGPMGRPCMRAGSPPGNLRQDADGREDLVVGDKVVFFLMTFLFLVK